MSNHFAHHAKPQLQVFCRVNGSTSSAAMVLAKYSGPHETRHCNQQLFSIRPPVSQKLSLTVKVYHVQSSFLALLGPFSLGLLCPLAEATTNLAPQASMELRPPFQPPHECLASCECRKHLPFLGVAIWIPRVHSDFLKHILQCWAVVYKVGSLQHRCYDCPKVPGNRHSHGTN